MNDKIKDTFDRIRADEALKNGTREFIAKKTRGYTRGVGVKRGIYVCGAACACLLLLFFGVYWLYFTPAFEISIDINPSLELSVNRFEQVISVSGFNEDGRELVQTLDLNFRHYTDAVDLIMQNEKISALLSDNEIMSITVAGSDEDRSAEVLSRIEECTAHSENTHCYYLSSEKAKEAHGSGLSCGRYRLYSELRSLGSDITTEKIGEMSVREIEELIESLSCESGETASGDSGHGHHHHGG